MKIRWHRNKLNGHITDEGRFAEVAYPVIVGAIENVLKSHDVPGTLEVSPYFHETFLLACNRYNVRIVDMLRLRDFLHLSILVTPELPSPFLVHRGIFGTNGETGI